MGRFILPALILAIAVPALPAQAATWAPDQAHSEVDFSVLHMSLSNVHGRFGTSPALSTSIPRILQTPPWISPLM